MNIFTNKRMWFNNPRDKEIKVFKILNGYENIYRNFFLTQERTGGHEVNKKILTLNKLMASLSTCHLGPCLRWQSC